MIRSFRHRGLRRFFERGDARRLDPEHVPKIRRILARLNEAQVAEDMNLPGYRLHPLGGDRAGFWAVTVAGNWRIVFRFEDGAASDVDYLDYH